MLCSELTTKGYAHQQNQFFNDMTNVVVAIISSKVNNCKACLTYYTQCNSMQ